MSEEQIFWERLCEMPLWEAEQECVSRREWCNQRIAELAAARSNYGLKKRGQSQAFDDLGVEQLQLGKQLSLIGERIKYLRKLQERIHWKETIRDLYGEEAVEQCIVHMEQRLGDIYTERRKWAAKKT